VLCQNLLTQCLPQKQQPNSNTTTTAAVVAAGVSKHMLKTRRSEEYQDLRLLC
jgi:hypothetical protein